MNNFRFEYDTFLDWRCSCDTFTDYYIVFHNDERCATLVVQTLCQSSTKELVLTISDCPTFNSSDRFVVIEEFMPILFQSYYVENFDKIYYKTWCPPKHLLNIKHDKCISGDYCIDLLQYSEGRYV